MPNNHDQIGVHKCHEIDYTIPPQFFARQQLPKMKEIRTEVPSPLFYALPPFWPRATPTKNSKRSKNCSKLIEQKMLQKEQKWFANENRSKLNRKSSVSSKWQNHCFMFSRPRPWAWPWATYCGLVLPFYGLLLPFHGLLWQNLDLIGLASSSLTVLDPN